MVRSMTGYGRGEYTCNGKEFKVEIKSVNHRYCEINVRINKQYLFLEELVREVVTKTLSRGKIEVFVSYEDVLSPKKLKFDESLAEAYLQTAKTLRDKYNLADDISVSMFFRIQDLFKIEKSEENEDELKEGLTKALEEALASVVSMREKEGLKLQQDIFDKIANIENNISKINSMSDKVVIDYNDRLKLRLKELLDQNIIDEQRIAAEVAIFAERCCIDEELTRMTSHVEQFKQVLSEDSIVGRKLDFIVQEMNREINTIGSKANDALISKLVVEVKSDIEKIREQIQNIE